ncbi:MAG TPA: ATP-grasp domain-containing protein [Candidatus Limnocylindrales bacterium]|nr:ATP-grasp domain-containing protein [Candidatus Limnocylindrales bacterium]
MNVVFLSPHFPPNWYRFVMALHAAGANTLGIADSSWDELRPELRDSLNDYYRVDNLGNYDQLTRALGYFIHRHGRIDRLDSLNEHWLETEAALRTDFNIPGIDQRGIAAIKRKSLMKRRFVAAGLPVARGEVCRTLPALKRFVGRVGYPVVAKPDVGVGAAKTYKLENDDDLVGYAEDKLPVDYIIEEFVPGAILTYDGLIGRDGEVVFDSTLIYSTGVMESVNEQKDLYYWIPRQIPDEVRDVGQRMAKAFDLRERPFHFEMFRTPDRGLVPLEVNMRPPGGLTVDMFNYANDFDFYRQWANMVVHGRFDAVIKRPYACVYVSRRDGVDYALTHDEVMHELSPSLVHQTRMDSVFAAAIGDHGYLLRGPELEPLFEAARRIQARPG